jgi:hypothetical protein
MQHLGTENQLVKVLRDLWATMSPAEQEEALARTPISVRLAGIPAEERLQGLTPEELERLRQLLQQPPTSAGDPSSPK